MSTFVAFLRAINLGANRRFGKDAIVLATEAAGFTDVATHINTGNVRLRTTLRSRARIEAALERAYLTDRGFEVPTIVFGTAELRDVVAASDRMAEENTDLVGARQYVSLLKDEPGAPKARELESRSTSRERAVVRGRAVHFLLEPEYHAATLSNAVVERLLGVATNRNLTVVRAVTEKWC